VTVHTRHLELPGRLKPVGGAPDRRRLLYAAARRVPLTSSVRRPPPGLRTHGVINTMLGVVAMSAVAPAGQCMAVPAVCDGQSGKLGCCSELWVSAVPDYAPSVFVLPTLQDAPIGSTINWRSSICFHLSPLACVDAGLGHTRCTPWACGTTDRHTCRWCQRLAAST
jgi:hypothetical protein